MTTYTSLPKLLFDPEVYLSILDEILLKTKVESIDMYTLIFLNSIYMNEMLDQDVEWKDRNDEEQKEWIESRIKSFIQLGIELVKINYKLNNNNKLSQKVNITPQVKKTIIEPVLDNVTFSDYLDDIPEDMNDEYYKKVNKLNNCEEKSVVKFT